MADEYCSTPARALGLVLPPPGRAKTALWAERRSTADEGRLTERQRALLDSAAALDRCRPRGAAAAREARARRPSGRAGGARAVTHHLVGDAQRPRLTADQAAARSRTILAGRPVAAARRDRLRQDRGVPAASPSGLERRRDRARPGDRPDAADRGAFRRALRRHRGGPALEALRRRALRRVAPAAAQARRASASGRARRSSRRSSTSALVIVDEEHDPSYKHEGDPRYDARLVAERRAGDGLLVCGSATPRPRDLPTRLRRVRLPERVDGRPLPPVEVIDMRGRRRHAAPAHARGAGRCAQGDRAAQPPRLVELPHLPDPAATRANARVRRHARAAPRRERAGVPPLRPPRASAPTAARPAAACRSPATAPGPSGSSTNCGRPPSSGSTPTSQRRRRACSPRFEAADRGVLVGHAGRRQGPRLPGRRARRGARRRRARCASRTSAPRSGRSRSSPSWPGGRGAARDGRVLVQTVAPDAPAIRLAAKHDADTFRPRSCAAARRSTTRRSRR